MIEKRTWKEFRESGLLWWVNKTLHLFGWVIAFDNGNCFPARSNLRGFTEEAQEKGFKDLTKHIADNIDALKEDTR